MSAHSENADRAGDGTSEAVEPNGFVVEVLFRSGMTQRVVAEALIGGFAIHPRVFGGGQLGAEWAVTHRETGQRVWQTLDYQGALRVARYLDDNNIIPEGKAEALAWSQKIRLHQRLNLRLELAKITSEFRDEIADSQLPGTRAILQ